MTPSLSTFSHVVPTPTSKLVKLLNGHLLPITHQGSITLGPNLTLKNVLHVPSFLFNLLSINKLTESLNCAITFFPSFCVLQDLSSRKLIGASEMRDGLYYVSPSFQNNLKAFPSMRSSINDLWN